MGTGLKDPKTIAIIVLSAIILIGAGAAAGYFATRPADDVATEAADDNAITEDLTEPAGDEAAEAEEPESAAAAEEAPAETPAASGGPAASSEPDGRYPGIITSIPAAGGGWEIITDYVQILVGDDANAAAAARGLEVPVPNDYLVLNENPRLRTIPVASPCPVLMHDTPAADPNNGFVMGDVTLTFDDFRVNRWGALPYYRGAIYYITISGGRVTNLEHFWVP